MLNFSCVKYLACRIIIGDSFKVLSVDVPSDIPSEHTL